MKKIALSLFVLQLLLLGGCSPKEEVSDLEPETPSTIEVEDQPTETEVIEGKDEIEEQPAQLEEETNQVPNTQTPQQPFIENGFGRSFYESKPYLTLGDMILVTNNGIEVGTVSLDRYEIIEDELGSGRKGLQLWLTETNTSSQALQVGLYGLDMLSYLNVFYEELELKRLSDSIPLEAIEGEEYLKLYHVQYTSPNPELQSCTETVELQPGESRVCYQTYSYAGPGEYLISQAQNDQFSAYNNYLLKLE